VLDVQHLRKSFGTIVAVDDVSVTLPKGELVGLLGPNRAGKSTTVSLIAGLLTVEGGEVTTLAVLMMVMLGGAWVPAFVFPGWLQQATKIVPVRWAVDGLDAMTWRGLGLAGAAVPILVLLGFAAIFGAVAATRFRWEEA
jgi:ABC-type multidrug transport system permease subunit